MPSTLPHGDAAPASGALSPASLATLPARELAVYVHVPFCASRCGYCDFNTYTAAELGGGASQLQYADTALLELDVARRVLGERAPKVSTVFFGGGTPTLLPAGDLRRLLDGIRQRFGLHPDAEVTTEANPESVDARSLAALREAGFTRISFGMQSAAAHVLATLDRRHTPGRPAAAVAEARAAGFEHVSVDLIYGTPGETEDDWRHSLDVAIGTGVDHVSAYSLIVEPGTRLAARVGRRELPAPDDDVLADRYLLADRLLGEAGFHWYEVSNWARSEPARCRHNLLYWTSGNWWGVGPGAHSHVGGTRWWNVRHPRSYAQRLEQAASPAAAREELTPGNRRVEAVMLALRLSSGLPLAALGPAGAAAATRACADGLLDTAAHESGRAVLTLRGRLLADAVVRELIDDVEDAASAEAGDGSPQPWPAVRPVATSSSAG